MNCENSSAVTSFLPSIQYQSRLYHEVPSTKQGRVLNFDQLITNLSLTWPLNKEML